MIACSTTVASMSSLDDALAKIAAMGFKYVDLLAMDGWVHFSPQELADNWEETFSRVDGLLKKHKLNAIAINASPSVPVDARDKESNARRLEETVGIIRFMNECGIAVASLQPKCASKDAKWDATLKAAAETFREQTAMAKAAGVTFGVELHQGSKFETMDQARKLLDAVPGLAVIYDPSHLVMQGIDIKQNEWLFDLTAHVHLRDAALNRMCVPLGEGLVDFKWVLDQLKKREYKGHVAIECLDADGYDAAADAWKIHDMISVHSS